MCNRKVLQKKEVLYNDFRQNNQQISKHQLLSGHGCHTMKSSLRKQKERDKGFGDQKYTHLVLHVLTKIYLKIVAVD